MKRKTIASAAVLLLLAGVSSALGQAVPAAKPEEVGMSSQRLANLDRIIQEAVARKDFPGAVLLVTHKGRTVYRKAFGESQWVPGPKPMTVDMIFDMASVTKPVATATSVMILVEQGRIRLWDKVKEYVPDFAPYIEEKGIPGRGRPALAPPDPYLGPAAVHRPQGGREAIRQSLLDRGPRQQGHRPLPKETPAGKRFNYSCLNYITLAYIVKKTTGQTIAEFAAENIFKPLGMKRTFYNPPPDLVPLCVPTLVIDGKPLRGVVHDPLARLQGGVSGNAGLFSTADDLAVFAQMMLQGGEWNGVRILSPLAVGADDRDLPQGRRFRPGPRLGPDLRLRHRPRRPLRLRLLRPLGLHGDVDLDRPRDADGRHLPDEPRPPGRQGRHHRHAEQGRQRRRRLDPQEIGRKNRL